MKVKPTLVRLPEGVAERIDALVGEGRRAQFIREAVERELERSIASTRAADQQRALDAVRSKRALQLGSYFGEDVLAAPRCASSVAGQVYDEDSMRRGEDVHEGREVLGRLRQTV